MRKMQTSPGNHERDDPHVSRYYADGTSSLFSKNDGGGECGVPYQAYFPMPGPAAHPQDDAPWYSFDYGAVHFTVMSTEHGMLCVRMCVRVRARAKHHPLATVHT